MKSSLGTASLFREGGQELTFEPSSEGQRGKINCLKRFGVVSIAQWLEGWLSIHGVLWFIHLQHPLNKGW